MIKEKSQELPIDCYLRIVFSIISSILIDLIFPQLFSRFSLSINTYVPTILLQFWPVFIAEGVALKKQEELASHKLDGLECLHCWEKRRSSFFRSFLRINFSQ